MTRDKKSGKAAFNYSNSHAHTRTLILARSCANAAAAAVRLGARRAYCLARERERRLELRRALPRDRQLCRERRLECRRALPRRHAHAPRQRLRALRPPRAAIPRQSETIRGNPKGIRCNQWRSEAIRGKQRRSEAIRGNQRHSVALRGRLTRLTCGSRPRGSPAARGAPYRAHPASLEAPSRAPLPARARRAAQRSAAAQATSAVSSTASTSRWLSLAFSTNAASLLSPSATASSAALLRHLDAHQPGGVLGHHAAPPRLADTATVGGTLLILNRAYE